MKAVQTLMIGSLFIASHAVANDSDPDLAFGQSEAYQQVNSAVDTFVTWAGAEYLEHENEGLFKHYPQDGKVIKTTLNVAEELKQQATKASLEGDNLRAQALLFAAEATALYAAKMPHLLEKRVDRQTSNR